MLANLHPKRVDLIALVMIAVMGGFTYFVMFHRNITKYVSLKKQEKALLESLASSDAAGQTQQRFQEEIQAIQSRLDEFNTRFPKEKNIDEILKQISRASSRTGVYLLLVEPQAIEEGEMYNRFPIKIHFQGAFNNCFRFFSQMENLPRVVQLEKLTADKRTDSANIDIEMLLSAFMIK